MLGTMRFPSRAGHIPPATLGRKPVPGRAVGTDSQEGTGSPPRPRPQGLVRARRGRARGPGGCIRVRCACGSLGGGPYEPAFTCDAGGQAPIPGAGSPPLSPNDGNCATAWEVGMLGRGPDSRHDPERFPATAADAARSVAATAAGARRGPQRLPTGVRVGRKAAVDGDGFPGPAAPGPARAPSPRTRASRSRLSLLGICWGSAAVHTGTSPTCDAASEQGFACVPLALFTGHVRHAPRHKRTVATLSVSNRPGEKRTQPHFTLPHHLPHRCGDGAHPPPTTVGGVVGQPHPRPVTAFL